MTDVAVTLAERESAAARAAERTTFPELAWAHFKWERTIHTDEHVHPEVEARYRRALAAFERDHGTVYDAYWSTTNASGVAITIKRAARPLCWIGKDPTLRFHRATDWVTKGAPEITDVMQRCDTLAIRASEVLRGTTERIALQRILAVASHLLGFIDRSDGKPEPAEVRRVAESQTRELGQVKEYYFRAGHNAARIVYFWGMMVGAAALTVLAPLIWLVMHAFNVPTDQLRTFFACYAAGGIGALVSVMSRMNKGNSFTLDFEVGRPALRRLGSFRPFLGAVFGVVTYFVLESGLLETTKTGQQKFFYYGTLAFVAGFSERWTKVLLGAVERTGLGGTKDDEKERRATTG
jgi:hypothetical protein